jgi:hypothetical protein
VPPSQGPVRTFATLRPPATYLPVTTTQGPVIN